MPGLTGHLNDFNTYLYERSQNIPQDGGPANGRRRTLAPLAAVRPQRRRSEKESRQQETGTGLGRLPGHHEIHLHDLRQLPDYHSHRHHATDLGRLYGLRRSRHAPLPGRNAGLLPRILQESGRQRTSQIRQSVPDRRHHGGRRQAHHQQHCRQGLDRHRPARPGGQHLRTALVEDLGLQPERRPLHLLYHRL